MKRPLAWRIDDALGTAPLFDVIATVPRHGLPEWLSSIRLVVGKLASPSGRAWMAWRRAEAVGGPKADRRYRRVVAFDRLKSRRRARA